MPNLEPGPIAKKRKRRPSPKPELFDDAMVSLNEGLPKSMRFATLAEAEEYKRGIDAAVYWIRRWGPQELGGDPERYKVRGNPFVSEHYVVNGEEIDADDRNGRSYTDHYWKTNFYLRQPEKRGMAAVPEAKMREIQQLAIEKKRADAAARADAVAAARADARAAAARAAGEHRPVKRTVAIRGE